jgi:hypothetical protein
MIQKLLEVLSMKLCSCKELSEVATHTERLLEEGIIEVDLYCSNCEIVYSLECNAPLS